MSIDQARQEIQKQKELPTLSPDIQRILTSCENPAITQSALAEILIESPTIAARLLGLANSSFFGQQGRVHSISNAISVLGLVTVRSVAVGLALSGIFKTDRCPHFHAERYWASAVMTALMSSAIYARIPEAIRPRGDSVYMTGLLQNLGLLALVYLYPEKMDQALAAFEAAPERRLADHIKDYLEVDHYEAGVWLGSKWHLPEDILLAMKHHHDANYRGEHWPLVLLEGLCARWSQQIMGEHEGVPELQTMAALGLTTPQVEKLWENMRGKRDAIQEMASLFSKG